MEGKKLNTQPSASVLFAASNLCLSVGWRCVENATSHFDVTFFLATDKWLLHFPKLACLLLAVVLPCLSAYQALSLYTLAIAWFKKLQYC